MKNFLCSVGLKICLERAAETEHRRNGLPADFFYYYWLADPTTDLLCQHWRGPFQGKANG
jgi:hypothetical protein